MGKRENTERAVTQPCILLLSGLSPLYFTKGTTMHVHKKRNEKKKHPKATRSPGTGDCSETKNPPRLRGKGEKMC